MQILHASQNNLKNISLYIPENQLIVVTGLSGSGKSSLAMDVIGNEGMRYFLESLPAYSSQNGLTIPTAKVDEIRDLPPVIKVEQSKRFRSVNSTFGTLSEMADVFRILFARYSTAHVMSKSLFSFNHPKGACEICHGIGEQEFIDVGKLIADENKTLREGAITTTLPNGYLMYSQVTLEELNKVCAAHGFSVDIPWKDLSSEQQNVVLNGSERIKVFYGKHSLESRLRWTGIKAKPREKDYYKGMLPIMEDILKRDRNANILKFVSSRPCPSCHGARIKAAHLKFRWKDLNFNDWMQLPLKELIEKLKNLSLNSGEAVLVAKLKTKLTDFIHLGMMDYSLSTLSDDISSGDAQRIKLINCVNGQLQGLLYIFDEPSIGLPAAYQKYLLQILKRLIRQGNTVMVVEHDLDFIQSADWIVELGPKAGEEGGEVLFSGSLSDFKKTEIPNSPTQKALKEDKSHSNSIALSTEDFKPKPQKLILVGRETQNIRQQIENYAAANGLKILEVDDQPIGKTPRSNPATYTDLADKIRDLMANTDDAKKLDLSKSAFSFNTKVGRCETCEGAGVIRYAMSTFGTVNQTCPTCNGKRFKAEVLKAQWKGKNIAEIYNLSIREAVGFFEGEKVIEPTLQLMIQLGLGYLQLGQPSNTLSGGEAQRIKLAKHFAKKSLKTLLILREPSIGLHYENLKELISALHQLKRQTAGIICFDNHPLLQREVDYRVENSVSEIFSDIPIQPITQSDSIIVKGAQTHSLKNITVEFRKGQLSVVTGVSGSGKTSLVIDTIHGFGLSQMTQQFSNYQQSRVGVNFQFEVESICGLPPTICITRKQKNYARSTDVAQQIGIDKILRFAFSRKAQSEGYDWSASHFSTRHQLGQCPVCEGLGEELVRDEEKVIPDPTKSIADGLLMHNKALAYYGDPEGKHMAILKEVAKLKHFDLQTPYDQLSPAQKEILFYGTGEKRWKTIWHYRTKDRVGEQAIEMPWEGIFNLLQEEYFQTRKNKNIEKLTTLFSYRICRHCGGSGLKPERLKIKIADRSIAELKAFSLKELAEWLAEHVSNTTTDFQFLERVQDYGQEIFKRARQLHVDHLGLNRKSRTLSGGENQRVELIKQLRSPLKGITYVLDEPSAGLSQDNIGDLLQIIRELIAKGNTVIAIEHAKALILAADKIVQLGPLAGKHGGEVLFFGDVKSFLKREATPDFLKQPTPELHFTKGQNEIVVLNADQYNLQREEIRIPIDGISALTGPSGIGKTTLVRDILIPSFKAGKPVHCSAVYWSKKYEGIHYFEPQKLRSYHATLLVDYLDLLPKLGKIFVQNTSLKPQDFSYKNKKSQCPNCHGKGTIETSLDIVANDVETCEVCHGKRYREAILQYRIASKSIADVLAMSLGELKIWLQENQFEKKAVSFLTQFEKIGLSHLQLDQPVQSLSSGEQQRLLLLDWLSVKAKNHLYILDEPGIGLFYSDIDHLFEMLQELARENDVLVIDHNPYLLQKIKTGLVLE